VRIALVDLALQPVWEGLARQRWNEAQIAELQKTLGAMNIIEDYPPAMRMERAASIYFIELLRTGKYRPIGEPGQADEDDGAFYAKIRFLPGGILRQNQLTLARYYQERLLGFVDLDEHTVDVSAVNRTSGRNERHPYHPYGIVANLLTPAVSRSVERFARGQVSLDLAVVACALERHRLMSGSYPESLDSLGDSFLTNTLPDVITGEPLKYRRLQTNEFLLYSVGWNESDDGGTPGLTPRKHDINSRQGDWVWRYHFNDNQAAGTTSE